MTSGGYLEPEQAWEDPAVAPSPFGSDPTTASIGFEPGQPAGSASPLTWAQATYARLAVDLGAGRNLETPAIVTDRYVAHGMPGSLPLTVTSPAHGDDDRQRLGHGQRDHRCRSRVVVEASGTLGHRGDRLDHRRRFGALVAAGCRRASGPTTITVTGTLGRSTGYAQPSVTNALLPGTTVFNAADPTGDDNGPGTYGYPTAPISSRSVRPRGHAGQPDRDRRVHPVQAPRPHADVRANFGAQLLDLYVRNPSETATSTAAPFATRNYTIAPDDAWSQRLEVQGFVGPAWVDPSGNTVGSAQFVVDSANATATIMVPTAQFGTVGSGWKFTVALTGQDGFSPDQARAFAANPQPFTFGVCQPGNSSQICSVDPATVPKVVDTITPDGVSQATELDPTQGPVMLHGVTVPK